MNYVVLFFVSIRLQEKLCNSKIYLICDSSKRSLVSRIHKDVNNIECKNLGKVCKILYYSCFYSFRFHLNCWAFISTFKSEIGVSRRCEFTCWICIYDCMYSFSLSIELNRESICGHSSSEQN